jgi:hypothetical protein
VNNVPDFTGYSSLFVIHYSFEVARATFFLAFLFVLRYTANVGIRDPTYQKLNFKKVHPAMAVTAGFFQPLWDKRLVNWDESFSNSGLYALPIALGELKASQWRTNP